MGMSYGEAVLCIAGLAVITVLSRGFFVISEREMPLPAWLQQGLRYAPLAALAAVVVPEVLLTHGRFGGTLLDPKLLAAAAAMAWYFWRRGILGTIVSGMTVLLALRLGLGW